MPTQWDACPYWPESWNGLADSRVQPRSAKCRGCIRHGCLSKLNFWNVELKWKEKRIAEMCSRVCSNANCPTGVGDHGGTVVKVLCYKS